jgi:hypothetical protein
MRSGGKSEGESEGESEGGGVPIPDNDRVDDETSVGVERVELHACENRGFGDALDEQGVEDYQLKERHDHGYDEGHAYGKKKVVHV